MKTTLVAAAAAALVGSVAAAHGRHAHGHFHAEKRGGDEGETCVPGCTTIYTTITGSPGLWTPPPPSSTAAPVTSSAPVTVPTPIAQTCPTPGTYTFPATTVVVTETTTVCAASTTKVPSGTHTLGGVTTVVETETTIVCPYATTKSESGVVTSVIETTTYVCPSAGTYTIAPVTTTVTVEETVVVVPVVTTYCPGTYTAPAVVTTITETDVVVYCPFETPAPSSTSAPAPAASSPAPKLGGKGNQWAMTYTPYTSSGGCKSQDEVLADITAIKNGGFTTVRLYSTDCSTLPFVGAACEAVGLKVIVGIFIGEAGVCSSTSSVVSSQLSAITAWGKWDLVELVAVANEAMFNDYCTISELVQLISDVKSILGGAGYTGPCTTTDVVSAWQAPGTSALCSVLDVIGCNIHAFFNAQTTPSEAGSFVAGQIQIVEAICPGKSTYVLESGWPNAGECNGAACPGPSEQATALQSIQQTCGGQIAFFSFCDDAWKDPGAFDVEQHWGCGNLWGAN